jgi:serine/threonine protein kinase
VLSPGEEFEGHVVDRVLGHGGYATVYRARDMDSDRDVALKVLHDDHRHLKHFARLRHEFEFARRLTHPHIVAVYKRGPAWLSMELVSDGGGIVDVDAMAKRLTALEQIAEALDYTHNRAIVHCDVKPANILVHQDFSRAVLIDFGVAHEITDDVGYRATQIEASLPYAAPELITGHAPTGATDEYALACTTVELITGSRRHPALASSMRTCTGRRRVGHVRSLGCHAYSTQSRRRPWQSHQPTATQAVVSSSRW